MSAPISLSSQLQQLLAALSQQGSEHLTEVQTDLQQTGYLLSGAIEKLGNSFVGIHESVAAQQALIETLRGGASLSPALQAELAQLQKNAAIHMSAAMTALQFQDMTSQLIGRMVGHVDSLRAVFTDVVTCGAPLSADSDDAAALGVLGAVIRTLGEKGAALESVSRKAVAQTHMESGDIELF